MTGVVLNVRQQTGDQRGAHHRHLAGDRVQQLDRVTVAEQLALPAFIDEAVVDGLEVIRCSNRGAQLVQAACAFALGVHRGARDRRQRRDVVKAIDAGDLLDQILFDLDVEAVAGRGDDDGLIRAAGRFHNRAPVRQAQPRENAAHFVGRNRHADDLLRTCNAHRDRLAGGHVDGLVIERTGLTAANLKDQRADAVEMGRDRLPVHATLKAVPGVGGEVVAAAAALNGERVPERGFDVDVLRVERHGRAVTAHDAGERFNRVVVGDDTDFVVELDGVAIEQLERFARLAPAHFEPAMHLVEIEHVRRAAELKHHVVGNVDQRCDRALAGFLQPFTHPRRGGGFGVDAAHHAASETAAQIRRQHFYRQHIGQRCLHLASGRRRQRRTGDGMHFARDAVDRQAVGLVRRQLDQEFAVVE